MEIDETNLKRIADEMGCTVEELKLAAGMVEDRVNGWTKEIGASPGGPIECIACGGRADYRRDGQSYVIECDCGLSACGQVPESVIQHKSH